MWKTGKYVILFIEKKKKLKLRTVSFILTADVTLTT